jgi:hypothetical protein
VTTSRAKVTSRRTLLGSLPLGSYVDTGVAWATVFATDGLVAGREEGRDDGNAGQGHHRAEHDSRADPKQCECESAPDDVDPSRFEAVRRPAPARSAPANLADEQEAERVGDKRRPKGAEAPFAGFRFPPEVIVVAVRCSCEPGGGRRHALSGWASTANA